MIGRARGRALLAALLLPMLTPLLALGRTSRRPPHAETAATAAAPSPHGGTLAIVPTTHAETAATATATGPAPDAPAAPATDAGIVAVAPSVLDPEAPTVAARVDRAVAHVGDPVTLTITTVSRRGVPVNLPNVVDLGQFSSLGRTESETDLGDGRVRREFVLTVAAYEPGPQTVPAIEVTYLGHGGDVRQTRTQPVPIKIASLIANEPEPALKDNAPPVPVWKQDLTLAIVAGGLLAAALGALVTWAIVRRFRQRIIVRPGPPPRPAHEVALERLDRLGAYGFLENADNRPFYFAVSEVIRDYLGGRFGFDSLELTTDELVDELRRRAGRTLVLGEIEGWLSACDLVKFAKVSPSATEARGALEIAISIVESTRPRPQPEATGSTTASATGSTPGSTPGSTTGLGTEKVSRG